MINNPCCPASFHLHCEGVPSCTRLLKVQTTAVSGPVMIAITDKFGHRYTFKPTTGADGIATIDLKSPLVPPSLLNPYAGLFDLTVKVSDTSPMVFPSENDFYEALRFEVVQTYSSTITDEVEGDVSTYASYTLPYVFELA